MINGSKFSRTVACLDFLASQATQGVIPIVAAGRGTAAQAKSPNVAASGELPRGANKMQGFPKSTWLMLTGDWGRYVFTAAQTPDPLRPAKVSSP